MITTFAETHTPVKRQAANPGFAAPMVVSPMDNYDTSRVQLAEEQVKHYRLWNYIAIHTNATRASEGFPNVGTVSAAAGPSSRLTTAQKNHLRLYYPVRQHTLDRITPVQDSHPLLELFRHVNSVDWWQNFAQEWYLFWQLTGAAYVWVIPNGFGAPAELWVVPTQWVTPIYKKNGELDYWQVRPDGDNRREKRIPPEELLFAYQKSPLSKNKPFSAVDAGSSWILNSEFIEKARKRAFENGLLTHTAITYDPDHIDTRPAQPIIDRLLAKMKAKFMGVENAHELMEIPPGMALQELGRKPQEMGFPESEAAMRDAVLALHKTPKSAAGLAHDLNKASIYGSNLLWCQNAIMPMQAMFAGFMTERLAPKYADNLVVWFDDCSPNDDEAERADQELDFAMGALSPEQRAINRGLEPPKGEAAKKTYIKMGFTPLEDYDDSADERAAAEQVPATPGGVGADDDSESDDEPASQQQAVCRHGVPQGTGGGQAVTLSKRQTRVIKLFGRYHSALERAAKPDVVRFYKRALRQVNKVLRENTSESIPDPDVLLPNTWFRANFNRSLTPHWKAAFEGGIELEANILGLPTDSKQSQAAPPSIDVELSPELREQVDLFLNSRADGIWSTVSASVHAELEAAIAKGVAEGLTLRERESLIRDVIGDRMSDPTTIARTEATASMNSGQQALREWHGVKKKEWIATFDGRTRPSHSAADSQVVENTKPFTVGGYQMMHPGDGSLGADAEEIVHCRCTSAGFIDD